MQFYEAICILELKLKLELIQTHMAQKPLLWVEAGAHVVRYRSKCGGVGSATYSAAYISPMICCRQSLHLSGEGACKAASTMDLASKPNPKALQEGRVS